MVSVEFLSGRFAGHKVRDDAMKRHWLLQLSWDNNRVPRFRVKLDLNIMNLIASGSYLEVWTKQRTLQLVPEVKGFMQHKAVYPFQVWK